MPPRPTRPANRHNRTVPAISSQHLVAAVLRVEQMSLKEREQLADEIHAQQPNLLYSVLALQRFGATLEQIEVVLNLLLVLHEAMKASGKAWPLICEDVQERGLKRISARVRFIDGLSSAQQAQATSESIGAQIGDPKRANWITEREADVGGTFHFTFGLLKCRGNIEGQ